MEKSHIFEFVCSEPGKMYYRYCDGELVETVEKMSSSARKKLLKRKNPEPAALPGMCNIKHIEMWDKWLQFVLSWL